MTTRLEDRKSELLALRERIQRAAHELTEADDDESELSNASGDTESWHNFGMELKEHIAWAAPFLATAVAFIVAYYGARLIKRPWLRAATIVMFVGAFAAAAIGGFFGAFLNKIAPIV